MTFIFCGWQNVVYKRSGIEKKIPFTCIVSNCIDDCGNQTNQISNKFRVWIATVTKPKEYIFLCRGDLRAFSDYYHEFIETSRYVRKPIPLETKVKIVRDFIKSVADITETATKEKTIGKNILGGALLPTDNDRNEMFDFPEDPSVEFRTSPDVVWANGNSITGFLFTPNEPQDENEKSDEQTEPKYEKYLILSRWIGSGESIFDTRRAEVGDQYNLLSYSDDTGAPSWEKGKKCPYYGLLISCDMEPDSFSLLLNDNRYFVLVSDKRDYETQASENWLNNLFDWFIRNGMPHYIAEKQKKMWKDKKIGELIPEVKELLKKPRYGFEELETDY